VFPSRDAIVSMIAKEQVVVISGATGCGKSTQIVQYLLDDAIMSKRGAAFRCICTQPRRYARALLKL
jgi:ATP-dependent RNA helicase DHX36